MNGNTLNNVVDKIVPFFSTASEASAFCCWLWDFIYQVASEELCKLYTQVEADRKKWKQMFGEDSIQYETIVQYIHKDQLLKEKKDTLKKSQQQNEKITFSSSSTGPTNTVSASTATSNFITSSVIPKPLSHSAKFGASKDGTIDLKIAVKYGQVFFQPRVLLDQNDPTVTNKGNGEREIDCTKKGISTFLQARNAAEQRQQHTQLRFEDIPQTAQLQKMKANLIHSKQSRSASTTVSPNTTIPSSSNSSSYSQSTHSTSNIYPTNSRSDITKVTKHHYSRISDSHYDNNSHKRKRNSSPDYHRNNERYSSNNSTYRHYSNSDRYHRSRRSRTPPQYYDSSSQDRSQKSLQASTSTRISSSDNSGSTRTNITASNNNIEDMLIDDVSNTVSSIDKKSYLDELIDDVHNI